MVDCYISANSQYAYENEKYYKNGAVITNDTGNVVDEITFKSLIKKETSTFIHKSFSDIIVLVGAGASVLCDSGNIDSRFGKTVFMLADLINATLKAEDDLFTLQELSNLCKYNIPVEIEGEDGIAVLNQLFNLEDFLSDLLSFEKYVSDMERDKYIKSKNKIFDLIKKNTSYEYDNRYLKHSAFINTVSHLVRTPSKLTIVTTNYDTLLEDAADSIGYTVMDGFSFSHRPYFDSDMFEWNLVRDIENVKTRELEYKKNIINLLKLHGSLTWERDEKGIRRKEKTDVSNPIMREHPKVCVNLQTDVR